MRAACLVGSRELRLVDVPEPVAGPGEVVIRLRACGICGSDLNAWRGVPGIEYPLPAGAPGHETWGEVVALGAGVSDLSVGQCVTGLLWNGLAEFGVARAEHLVALDAPLLGEPLACAMNVVRRAAPTDEVTFVGFGYLAALCAQLLPKGTRWSAVSRRASSRALALRLGAHTAYAFENISPELWDSLPLVIEAAGVQQTLDFATWLVAYGGRLVIAGYHADGPRSVNMQTWNWKGIDVVNAHDRKPEVIVHALREGLAIVAARGLETRVLHTHDFALDEAAGAFQAAEDRPPGFVKAIVRL
jgi:threonine dehydrogenase-like Zn-dependent dehydrogenase